MVDKFKEIDEKIMNLVLNDVADEFIDIINGKSSGEDINLFDDLNYDSIKFLQLIINLEESFQIEFNDEVLLIENFSTVAQIKHLISNLIVEHKEPDIMVEI